MIRGLFRLVLLLIVVALVGAYMLGWRFDGRVYRADAPATTPRVDAGGEKTREIAKTAGARASQAADATRRALGEGSLTAKIKAKMALDDHVKAFDLNVDTVGSVVTVTGTVNTVAERDRALALARDTQGVTQVVDRLEVKQK